MLQQLKTARFVLGGMRERVVRCLTHSQNRKLRYRSPSGRALAGSGPLGGAVDQLASAARTFQAMHPREQRLIEPLRFFERREVRTPIKEDVGVQG